jgi:hypothetical protein
MHHEPECDTRAHVDYQDGSDPGPCNTALVSAGPVSVWIRFGPNGPQARFDAPPAASMTPVELASLCSRGLALAASVGAFPPGPRRPSAPQV